MDSEPPSVWTGPALILILYGLYFLISAISTSLRNSRRSILEEDLETFGKASYARALKLHEDVEYYLAVCIFLHFVFVASIGAVSASWGSTFSCQYLFPDSQGACLLASVAVFIVIVYLALVLVQPVKALAVTYPELVLRKTSWILKMLGTVVYPVIFSSQKVSRPLLRLAKVQRAKERAVARSAEEIGEIVAQSNEAGNIKDDEGELLQGVVQFSGTLAHEIMTPRKDIISVTEDSSLSEVVEVFKEEGISRLVVTGDNLDDVKGILMAKDLIPLLSLSERITDIRPYIREHISVPGTMSLDRLLKTFKLKAMHFAIVMDEHGGVDGIITLEDLVEEILGDIFDEHDVPEEELEVVKTRSGALLIDGSTLIDDLNEEYDLDFPDGEYDTIAGFIIDHLDRIPEQGETVEYNGFNILVEKVNHNRILSVRLNRVDEPVSH